jgi:hypothetical protein
MGKTDGLLAETAAIKSELGLNAYVGGGPGTAARRTRSSGLETAPPATGCADSWMAALTIG